MTFYRITFFYIYNKNKRIMNEVISYNDLIDNIIRIRELLIK